MTTRTENTVVTGLGVVAPNGLGTEEFWTATLKGISGIDRISRYDPSGYPSPLAGEVLDFNASDHLSNRMLPQTDRMTQMALAASDWALSDAGVDPAAMPEFDMGVVTASASGGFEFAQNELQMPLLAIHGELDTIIPLDACERMLEWAEGKTELILYPGERHVATNYFGDFIPRFCDWMSEQLGVTGH
uniref:Type II PKS CLF domain protein n=1 Tax=Streptomyces spiramyceticus TaxID=299717 RepID=C4IXS5_9ACTN|nr:type II PKS CLF domain protein [Streptomyces spiramyceticus]